MLKLGLERGFELNPLANEALNSYMQAFSHSFISFELGVAKSINIGDMWYWPSFDIKSASWKKLANQ